MPRAARWTCPGCRLPLGFVDREGTLTIEGQRVLISGVAADAGAIVIVICRGCSERRRWSPRPPGFETKVG